LKAKKQPPRWLLALDSHIAWGFGVPSFFAWTAKNFWLGALIILLIDLIKETTYDVWEEGEPFFWDGFTDWLEYWAGVLLALALNYILSALLLLPSLPLSF